MAIFNVPLDDALRHKLHQTARRQGVKRAAIIGKALERYFRDVQEPVGHEDIINDAWEEFSEVIFTALRGMTEVAIKTLPDPDARNVSRAMDRAIMNLENTSWNKSIEPVYDSLRRKVIEKSTAFSPNPQIETRREDAPFEPCVRFDIGFATDDHHVIRISLSELFSTYYHEAGPDAFAELPVVWAQAKATIAARKSGAPVYH